MNEYHLNLITMMEGNEEGDKTIEYFGNLIKENEKLKKENEELKKRDEEARKLFEESNEKMMERIKTEEDKVKEINKELDIYKEADTQMTSQIEEQENDYNNLKEEYEELEKEKEEWEYEKEGYDDKIEELEEQIKEDKETNEIKDELVEMYHIIMNKGNKDCELSKDQSIMDMIKSNITLMLEKFKTMSQMIEKLKEMNEDLTNGDIEEMEKQIKIYKTNEESRELLINELKTKLESKKKMDIGEDKTKVLEMKIDVLKMDLLKHKKVIAGLLE